MSTAWGDIKSNFRTLMNTYVTASVSNSFAEYKDSVDMSTRSQLPASVFNGAYAVLMNGMPSPMEYVNNEIDLVYNVRLQLAYELNGQDDGLSYDKACHDVEQIILKRLDATTFQDALINVAHTSTSPFSFVSKTDSQTFAIVNIDFDCIGRRFF